MSYLKKHKRLLCILIYCALGAVYFAVLYLGKGHHVIGTALDEKISFIPAAVIPYVLWYLYVPLPMLYMSFKDEEIFVRQMKTLFTGMVIANIFFLIYPTSIDFRPDTVEGGGILRWLCRLIYAVDRPVNVFPSLHCYEATAIQLSTFGGDHSRRHRALKAASGVLCILICLSTVFMRQHSVLDLISGCGLAAVIYFIVRKTEKSGDKNDHQTL